jgi:transposase
MVPLLAAQPDEKSAQQQFRVEAVSLCASMFARHRDAHGVNDGSCIVGAMKPVRAGREIKRIVVAYEAGRDGFWLARWLWARGVEAYADPDVQIPASVLHVERQPLKRLDADEAALVAS